MYNGISISEFRLIVHSAVFTILLICLTVAMAFYLYVSRSSKNPKDRKHLRKLKKRARKDEIAKAQLEKLKRKNTRRRKREKSNIITDIFVWTICISLSVVLLAWAVIPGWMDYIKKDYVVYNGKIMVHQQMKNSRIELEDGTTIWGSGIFDEGDTYGTVVYSRRTKQFLGGR